MLILQLTCGHHSGLHYTAHHHCGHYFSAQVNRLIVLRPERPGLPSLNAHTFQRSIQSIHTYTAVGPCFDPIYPNCAYNTIRSFTYAAATKPQHIRPFIHRFVRCSSQMHHSGHSCLLDSRRISTPTLPSFTRIRFPLHSHVGVQRSCFRPLHRHSNFQPHSSPANTRRCVRTKALRIHPNKRFARRQHLFSTGHRPKRIICVTNKAANQIGRAHV